MLMKQEEPAETDFQTVYPTAVIKFSLVSI